MKYKNCCNPKCQQYCCVNEHTGLCDDCHKKIFKKIKKYLEDVREQEKETGVEIRKDIHSVAAACKVPDRIIEGYVRDGSLQSIMREFNSNIKMCPNCGEIISQDGLCQECIKKLNNLRQLRDEINRDKVPDFKLPDTESHGMRYFNK